MLILLSAISIYHGTNDSERHRTERAHFDPKGLNGVIGVFVSTHD